MAHGSDILCASRPFTRHLYLECLKHCYLFDSCKPKFLDAVISACRADMFMPDVQLISEGDIVAELHIIIEGEVEICAFGQGGSHISDLSMSGSVFGGSQREGHKSGSLHGRDVSRTDGSRGGSFFGSSRGRDSARSGSFFGRRGGTKDSSKSRSHGSRSSGSFSGNSQKSFK